MTDAGIYIYLDMYLYVYIYIYLYIMAVWHFSFWGRFSVLLSRCPDVYSVCAVFWRHSVCRCMLVFWPVAVGPVLAWKSPCVVHIDIYVACILHHICVVAHAVPYRTVSCRAVSCRAVSCRAVSLRIPAISPYFVRTLHMHGAPPSDDTRILDRYHEMFALLCM